MAVTSKKNSKNSRLDFGIALDSALFTDKHDNESTSITYDDPNDSTQIDFAHSTTENVEIHNRLEEIKNVAEKISPQIDQSNHRSTEINLASMLVQNAQEDKDEDMFLAIVKGGRGVQRSVYFESDVYQYLKTKTKRYDVNFSNVVNLLIKYAIENMK